MTDCEGPALFIAACITWLCGAFLVAVRLKAAKGKAQ